MERTTTSSLPSAAFWLRRCASKLQAMSTRKLWYGTTNPTSVNDQTQSNQATSLPASTSFCETFIELDGSRDCTVHLMKDHSLVSYWKRRQNCVSSCRLSVKEHKHPQFQERFHLVSLGDLLWYGACRDVGNHHPIMEDTMSPSWN